MKSESDGVQLQPHIQELEYLMQVILGYHNPFLATVKVNIDLNYN